MDDRTGWRSYVTFSWVAATLVGAVAVAVWRAGEGLGYTKSLVLFVAPLGVLLWWFARFRGRVVRRAYLWAVGLLAPIGFGLDLLFAKMFFLFPNEDSVLGACETAPVLGACVPVWGGWVPVEEFVFYATGFMVVLLFYVWCDEHWLAAYGREEASYREHGRERRLLKLHVPSVVFAVGILVVAVAGRRLAEPEAGFPGYFVFLVLFALAPSAGLFPSVCPFVNWRAFSMTFLAITLVSVVWEVTLALPLGWWDYDAGCMLGLHIAAWSDLPVEAVLVWLAVTYASVIVYEAIKLWRASGESAHEAFLTGS